MRSARRKDLHRHLVEKIHRWSSSLDTFSTQQIPGLGSIDISFTSPFTVICGPNGIGKSTLLHALRLTLDGDAEPQGASFAKKLNSGGSFLSMQIDGARQEIEAQFNNGVAIRSVGSLCKTVFISTGEKIFSLQDSLCEFNSRDDLVNGAGTKILSEKELQEVNYIVKRDYRQVCVSEVELNEISPYFEVTYGDDSYDSRTMGTGELAALYIWWKIKSAEKNSFILLEEPETFLSPATQESISNFLVSESYANGHCITMTTHSAAIISSLPPTSLKFMFRAGGTLRVAAPPTPILLEKLGIKSVLSMILMVEDIAAGTFLKHLLEEVDPVLSASVRIEVRNGHGGVTRALREVCDFQGPVKFIGMYDGDMRANEDILQIKNALFLPGNEPIESAFRKLVIAHPEQLAVMRGVATEKILEILSSAEGADIHDWYYELCTGLGLTHEQLLSNLFVLWKRIPSNGDVIKEWLGQFVEMQ